MPRLFRALPTLWRRVRPRTVLGRMYMYATPWGIPIYGYIYWGPAYLHSWPVLLGGTLIFAAMSGLCVAGGTAISTFTVRRFPEPQQVLPRVGLTTVLLLLFIVLGTMQTMWLFDATRLFGYQYTPSRDKWVLLSVAVIYVLIAVLAEVVYALSQWRSTELEAQQLEKQQVQAQLDEVKQQVSPHFLFNSLNSLSVLIGEDPQQAERFVDEMATVYRYLLQAHRPVPSAAVPAGLTTLEAELRFLQSYAYLLRTRYGAGLEVNIGATDAAGGALLPLTLQTLIDNAIRHNVVAAATPLRIDVATTAAGQLRVRNTLQPRSVRVPLNREGLATLQSRYHLLGGPEPVRVEADAHHFTVYVPLVRML